MGVCLAAQALGYDSDTPEQRLVIESFVMGQDVFVSLPTGSGKSLCYWLLPAIFDRRRGRNGSILVVSC